MIYRVGPYNKKENMYPIIRVGLNHENEGMNLTIAWFVDIRDAEWFVEWKNNG